VWPEAGLEWSAEANEVHKQKAGLNKETLALCHPLAGWIQTQALVKEQLSHPNISCRFETRVLKLIRQASGWQLIDNSNQVVAQANHVIIANAHACQDLLNGVQTVDQESGKPRPQIPITPLRGQVTFGPMHSLSQDLRSKLPTVPVNGHGSFIGNLPALQSHSEGPSWIVGSSFQRCEFDTTVREEDQQSNLKQWAELMPAWHDEILKNVDVSNVKGWAGIRAALPDRLPAVGAFQHPDFEGLQMCTGMGARGISWSVLCGELLASQLNHEPLPMAASLAKLMTAARFG
jgi:tRNA 5-methylaminomethyl-2-thiouridine biosynthesis bifunctional protein